MKNAFKKATGYYKGIRCLLKYDLTNEDVFINPESLCNICHWKLQNYQKDM